MIKPASQKIQFILFALLVGAASVLWLTHSELAGAVVSAVTGKDQPAAKQNGQQHRNKVPRAVIPVIVAAITTTKNDENIIAIGTARARRHIMLRPKTDGQLTAFLPKAGDRVAAGQIIFKLDTAQAKLAVKLAEKRLEDAQRLLGRQQQLQQRRVASSARVVDYRMDAERAQLVLLQAQKSLHDLRIEAPFSGVVGLPSAEVGERVTTSTDLVSLDDRLQLLVEFKVPERYAMRIRRGDKLHFETPSIQGRSFAGHIEYIDSRIDAISRTVKVRGIIPNDKDLLRPGMSFAVEMVLPGTPYPSVPELSLQWRKGDSYIWVVREGTARKLLVTTIQRQNDRVLINGSVTPGELVVVEGVQRLRDGRMVDYEPPEMEIERSGLGGR